MAMEETVMFGETPAIVAVQVAPEPPVVVRIEQPGV
jgi:hypothetical protein